MKNQAQNTTEAAILNPEPNLPLNDEDTSEKDDIEEELETK